MWKSAREHHGHMPSKIQMMRFARKLIAVINVATSVCMLDRESVYNANSVYLRVVDSMFVDIPQGI
jgi:hypothetical protein